MNQNSIIEIVINFLLNNKNIDDMIPALNSYGITDEDLANAMHFLI